MGYRVMKALFLVFDVWLLDKFEKVGHRVQRATGVDCLDIGTMFGIAAIGFILANFVLSPSIGWAVFVGIVIAVDMISKFWLEPTIKSKKRSDAIRGTANSESISPHYTFMRIWDFWTTFFAIGLASYASICGTTKEAWTFPCWMSCFTCAAYFEACNPLPPCVGRIRELGVKLQEVKDNI